MLDGEKDEVGEVDCVHPAAELIYTPSAASPHAPLMLIMILTMKYKDVSLTFAPPGKKLTTFVQVLFSLKYIYFTAVFPLSARRVMIKYVG